MMSSSKLVHQPFRKHHQQNTTRFLAFSTSSYPRLISGKISYEKSYLLCWKWPQGVMGNCPLLPPLTMANLLVTVYCKRHAAAKVDYGPLCQSFANFFFSRVFSLLLFDHHWSQLTPRQIYPVKTFQCVCRKVVKNSSNHDGSIDIIMSYHL